LVVEDVNSLKKKLVVDDLSRPILSPGPGIVDFELHETSVKVVKGTTRWVRQKGDGSLLGERDGIR
jgi:hypothetical protein